MLYDIGRVAELTHVSKVTIYRKLKLQEVKSFVVVKNGKQFVEENGLNVIKEMLNLTTDETKDLNSKDIKHPSTAETEISITDLMAVKDTLIEALQSHLELVKKELDIKNTQLETKDRLFENMQVLLKDKPKQDIKLLEQHFQDLDDKIMNIKERSIPKQKGLFKNWFKK